MNAAFEWIRERWYIVLGILIGLWLLLKLVGNKTPASSSAATASPSGTSVVYSGTNANDAAVQVAQLQAQSTLAGQQISGALAVQQAQIAEDAAANANATNIQLEQIKGANALNITNANNAVSLAVSNNQTQVGLAAAQYGYLTSTAQYSAYRDVGVANAQAGAQVGIAQAAATAQVGVAQANSATEIAQSTNYYNYNTAVVNDQTQQAIAITQSNNQLAATKDTNASQLSAIKDQNATQLAAYGIQAGVVNNQTAALRDIAVTTSNNSTLVQTTALNDATSVQAAQLANQSQIIHDTYSLESSGQLNKGGEGGVNQVSVWNSLLSPTSASAGDIASAQVGVAQANTGIAGIISSIGAAVGTAFKSLAA